MKVTSSFSRYLLLAATIAAIFTGSFTTAVDADGGDCNKDDGTCQAYTILGKPEEYTASSTPGVKLAVRRWIPNSVKSVIVFHHGGAGWHTGYAEIMGRSMKEAGIAVVAYDTVGTGYSESINGLRGYYDMETLTSDFAKILQDVRTEFPGKKVFAMGESFGCMVLLTHILKEQGSEQAGDGILADGYVFTGPVVKVLPEMLPPKPVIRVLTFLARFFPTLKMPGTDLFSTFDLAFGDKGWAQAGRNDPFIREAASNPPRLGMAASVLTNMSKMYESLEEIHVPFKIFMGENEGRVDVDAVKHLAKVAKSKDKDIEIVKGGYHQLFQDVPDVTSLVCRRVQDWVLARS